MKNLTLTLADPLSCDIVLKDVYALMERWRHLLARDFNFAHDETVQRFSSRILSNDIVTTSFDKEIQEQFPGIVGLLPMIFHIAEQIMFKVRELLPKSGIAFLTRNQKTLLESKLYAMEKAY